MTTVGSGDWVQQLYQKEIDFNGEVYVIMLNTLKKLTAYYIVFYEGNGYEEAQALFATGRVAM